MVVGEIPESVDLLVVGGGPGGYVAALRAAQLNRSVTLVERGGDGGLGGTCLNVGCIPSKALIEVADSFHRVTAMAHTGLSATASVDLAQWQNWRQEVVRNLNVGTRELLRRAGVTTVSGELHFTRPTQAVVETTDGHARFFEFTDAIIATGSRPTPLSSLPRDGVAVLDSTDALALTAVPTSLAVVGGGYIGLELGTTFAKLGTRVTIVEALDRLLPTLDVALVRPVLTRLRQLGVSVITDTLVEDFDGTALRVRTGGSHQQIKADAVLVAVGRVPNTDELGLDRVGLRAGSNGLLEVGPDRRLSRHVAAIGDITPGPTLAHKASAEALVAAAALSGHIVAYDPMAVPAIVFSDPEIATAGLTQAQAREEGIETLSATFPLAASGRAATLGAKQGFLQVVADRETEAVIGTHIVGPHASELISEGVLAIEMGATLADVAGSIHPHPTLSEQFPEGAHLTLGQPIHFSPSANR